MYENEEPVLRRVLWIVLWFVIIVAVVWAIVWVVFFRNKNVPKPTLQTGKSHTSQSSGSSSHPNTPQPPATGSNSGSSANSGSNSGSAPSMGSPSTATQAPSSAPGGNTNTTQQNPQALANAGAGDVLVPFAVATMAGSAIYYVRLHKKLTR